MSKSTVIATDQSYVFPFLWAPPALLLITAALAKFSSPLQFLYELSNYNLHLPPWGEAAAALLLPGLELFLGLSLLLRPRRRSALAALLLIFFFSLGILMGLPAGYLRHCGCLGPEKLDPAFALLKNGLAILLLGLGCFPWKWRIERSNPWAALGLILGGSWTGAPTIIFILIGFLFAFQVSTKARTAYLLAVLLGLFLHLTGFPLLTLIAAAVVLYFFPLQELSRKSSLPLIFAILICLLTGFSFINPPPPTSAPRLLSLGQPLPNDLKLEPAPRKNDLGQYLLVFLRPDCDDCRDWLPETKALARRKNLPPLMGLIPQTPLSVDQYRQREEIPYPLSALNNSAFNWAVGRTPLLVLVQNDTVKMIYNEGVLPRAVALEALRPHDLSSQP